MIETREELCVWRRRVSGQREGEFALDLEADSMYRYKEKLCLIQYADADGVLLIDPLMIEDMTPFTTWLSEASVWMHGADYDRSLFRGAFGVLPREIKDTQIAARLLGFERFGLLNLVEHFYGVVLTKSSQKADWGRRPLSEKMVEYALNDVHYMIDMGHKLIDLLKGEGRLEWFEECCTEAHVRFWARKEEAFEEKWRIQGSGKLHPKGLAALRALWLWRDGEARLQDKPVFMVCNNATLIEWSHAFEAGKQIHVPHRYQRTRRQRLNVALENLVHLSDKEYPRRIKHPRRVRDEDFEHRLHGLTDRRNKVASELKLDPSFLASRAMLEEIASNEESGVAQLMNWQKKVLKFS